MRASVLASIAGKSAELVTLVLLATVVPRALGPDDYGRFSVPLTIVTLGLFLLVVNAMMIGLVDLMLGGFDVRGLFAGIMAAIVIGVASWMDIARLTRGEFLNLRASEFVSAARVVGMGQGRIAWRHVLPNASGPIIVAATLRVAEAIILESTLSFIGLGIQPPHASLGSMLQKGLTRLLDAPWMVWFPGLLIALTVLAINFVGDGIRDALDPKRLR